MENSLFRWSNLFLFDPLNTKIKIWILICCPYSFPAEVVGRNWWNIKQIMSVILSIILQSILKYHKTKFDAGHS